MGIDRIDTEIFLGNLFQLPPPPQFFFLCIPVSALCHLSCHWILLRTWLHLLIFLLRYLSTLSLPFSQLNNPSSISLSYVRCFNPCSFPWHFAGHAAGCLCHYLHGRPRTEHSTPRVRHQNWAEGKNHFSWTADSPLPSAAQDADASMAAILQ